MDCEAREVCQSDLPSCVDGKAKATLPLDNVELEVRTGLEKLSGGVKGGIDLEQGMNDDVQESFKIRKNSAYTHKPPRSLSNCLSHALVKNPPLIVFMVIVLLKAVYTTNWEHHGVGITLVRTTWDHSGVIIIVVLVDFIFEVVLFKSHAILYAEGGNRAEETPLQEMVKAGPCAWTFWICGSLFISVVSLIFPFLAVHILKEATYSRKFNLDTVQSRLASSIEVFLVLLAVTLAWDPRKAVAISLARTMKRMMAAGNASPADFESMRTEQGEVVAVTGDGVADIRVAMSTQGTEVAKDVIILDDSLASAGVRTVNTWGRRHLLNVQKYLQFRMTCCFTLYGVYTIVIVCTGEAPLTLEQLAWITLPFGSLSAIALAGEPPTDDDAEEPLISNIMWRNIISQCFYQGIVLLMLQFKGTRLQLKLYGPGPDEVVQTVIFSALVLCQLANLVNARKIKEMNVFQGIFSNYVLLGIMGSSLILLVIEVQFLNLLTVKLSWQLWLVSLGVGAACWPFACLFKLVPVPERLRLAGP